jgi:hypothetical protein
MPPHLLLPQNTPADGRERMQILMDGMSVRSAAQNGDVRATPLTGYPGVESLPSPLPFTAQWLEIFEIHSGQIHEIEAPVFIPLGFGAENGWDAGSGL